jgi:catechol 2,3-dioxygenase-like lactoylglutathione lyase family enzyme
MAGKIRTTRINHVTASVKDIARAMKFYNDLLGIKQIQSQVDNPEITWLQLESGIMLHLIESPDAPGWPERLHHAFEVEDFESTKQVLQENGYEITREGVRYDGQAFLFTSDPDGNRVEFCTGSGYAPAPPRP